MRSSTVDAAADATVGVSTDHTFTSSSAKDGATPATDRVDHQVVTDESGVTAGRAPAIYQTRICGLFALETKCFA